MNSDKSRLSWSADYPLPFESLWSILHKITIFNHIDIATICTMIQKDDSRINSWADSTWIDFERMGRLLRINPELLIAGTWENMEMTPAFKNGYSFRRCPECWRRGFHCVIFDIAWIINCPWHGCRLTEPCHQCGTKRTFQLSKKKDEYYFLQRVCSNCGLKYPNYRELLRQPQFTIEEKNWISESCIKFINWWKRLGRIFPSRGSLLNDLIWTENIKSHKNPDSLILKIDFSTQASKPFPNEWEFYKNADKAKFIILNNKNNETFIENVSIRSEAGKYYRSLRRHIYKKFIRSHCRCCKNLRSINKQEAKALIGQNICILAFSYLMLRLSVEGIPQIEDLHHPRKDDFLIKLMISQDLKDISFENKIQWTYCAFFSLIAKLRTINGPNKVRVMSTDRLFDGDLSWSIQNSSDKKISKNENIFILYPEFQISILGKNSSCKTDRNNLIDETILFSNNYWGSEQLNMLQSNLCSATIRGEGSTKGQPFKYVNI